MGWGGGEPEVEQMKDLHRSTSGAEIFSPPAQGEEYFRLRPEQRAKMKSLKQWAAYRAQRHTDDPQLS
ncbi:hypothetical protein Leryth_015603 [Lithospermum erythrorhizon]|nr:hypothetical protein Leryth_015603 [Lithospermum erythrorhizon]